MKKLLKLLLVLAALFLAGLVMVTLLTPWMDRWGATDAEINAALPGDELIAEPAGIVNRAVTIHASPEQIYPWIVQIGADKGGYYSYSWLETGLLRCPITNADRIHPEWQTLMVGDQVKLCPGSFGPPPYAVAQVDPNHAVVMGHKENGNWVETWHFVIIPQSDGTSRLILRNRSMVTSGFWAIIHPGIFIMERGMLLGIKERAEPTELSDLPSLVMANTFAFGK
jgi:hypothetical protein